MQNTDKREWVFSVIIPFHNDEGCLAETLESLISQTLSFRENIQVILVDSGSEDGTREIADKYQSRFPDNIMILTAEEAGCPASARNQGLRSADGKYISFTDADDLWSPGAFEKAAEVLDAEESVDLAAARIRYFDGMEGFLYEDEQEEPDRIVSINEEPDLVQIHANAVLYRAAALKGLSFDPAVTGWEGALFLSGCMARNDRYAIIYSETYNYRIRMDNGNLSRQYDRHPGYFMEDPQRCIGGILSAGRGEDGSVSPYFQRAAMTLISRRLEEKSFGVLSDGELGRYKEALKELIQDIDDSVILSQRGLSRARRFYALRLKNGGLAPERFSVIENRLAFDGKELFSLTGRASTDIEIMDVVGDTVIIEGRTTIPVLDEEISFFFRSEDGTVWECGNFPKYDYPVYSLGDTVYVQRGFRLEIPVKKTIKMNVFIGFRGEEFKSRIRYGHWSRLSNEIQNLYYTKNGICIRRKEKMLILDTDPPVKVMNKALEEELSETCTPAQIRLRDQVKKARRFRLKPVWLFADRISTASENGEYFYDFVRDHYGRKVKMYYALSRESSDYERMKKKANVIDFESEEFKVIYLSADKYVSSHSTELVIRPKGTEAECFRDLYPPLVYLQHGVLEKDLSKLQNKLRRNARIFVCSAPDEYRGLLDGNYGYTEREVKLTGLARHDLITDQIGQTGNRVIIAPTWRKNISSRLDPVKGGRTYNPDFIHSGFYRFYQDLMSDPRILSEMRQRGYTGVLKLHPYMAKQKEDFQENDVFRVLTESATYAEQFRGSALLITDYSSIAFEYAYVKRPVIYTQYDKDTFYQEHIYDQGYFDYERDGFGPVCYDYESTVEAILQMLRNSCAVEEVYQQRRDRFFPFSDGKNGERIYQEILRIDQEDKK